MPLFVYVNGHVPSLENKERRELIRVHFLSVGEILLHAYKYSRMYVLDYITIPSTFHIAVLDLSIIPPKLMDRCRQLHLHVIVV